MRVIEEPDKKEIRTPSRSTLPPVGRLCRSDFRGRAISMTSLSTFEDEIQSTSLWIRPEHIEHIIPHYVNSLKVLENQFNFDVEDFIKECKETWPLMEQCGMELELQELVPFLLKKQMDMDEFCGRLSKRCDAVINKSIPKKLEDSGRPEISCMIGHTWFERVPCDTGAGVNLMPYSVAKMLKFEELLNKRVLLRFADDTYKMTEGMLENVPVRANGRFIAVDFHVMKYDNQPEDPLILGIPFLQTAHAEIDCKTGSVKFKATEAIEAEKMKLSGSKPRGFERALIKGIYTPIQKFKRKASTTQHMFAASIKLGENVKEGEVKVVDLTEDEEDDDCEEDPMEEQEDEQDSSTSPDHEEA